MDAVSRQVAGLRALNGRTYVSRGLQELGIRADSNNSVLHLWARRFPGDTFDGHRSVMPAPDHLVFHGLSQRIITGLFDMLSKKERELVGTSLRDALAHSHLASTRIYNPKTDAVVSVGISEWAATLTVSAFVFKRVLPRALDSAGESTVRTPLQAGLMVLDAFTQLVNALYFYPRAELDGEEACRSSPTTMTLRDLGNRFFRLVCAACLRGDTAAFGRAVDVPNLHRLRELLDHAVPALRHVRHAQELLFENAHQPLKRAIVTGNGRDDAGRALERFRQCELASRILLEPAFFGIQPDWLLHDGVKAALRQTMPLWSHPSGAWGCWGGVLAAEKVPVQCQELVAARYAGASPVRWWSRAKRAGSVSDKVVLGDAVSVLVSSTAGRTAVNVARGGASGSALCHVAFFSVVALLNTPGGGVAAVVNPFSKLASSDDYHSDQHRFLFLPFDALVRRVLVLHSCQGACYSLRSGVGHSDSNRWRLFGRDAGYPSRSG